jgi:aspartate-semialdehyde dehydrogenase
VAVVGATGAVGEVLLDLLAERSFPIGRLVPLASARSAGDEVAFGRKALRVQSLDDFDFSGIDFAFFSAGGSVSAEHAPRAAAAGAVVIDNTSHFRMDPEVPLVVPEVNPEALSAFDDPKHAGIIANPNCSTIQMVVALAPIHREAGIQRINVATYQAVSGAGRKAMEELGRQTAEKMNFQDPTVEALTAPIAFNVIPRIDVFDEQGFTREERKMHNETRRILDDDALGVNATAVRVPVFYGHAEAVHFETRTPIELERVRELLAAAPGVELLPSDAEPTPIEHASGRDPVVVGRLRRDPTHPCGIDLWIVADNLRKGAALNAIQIAETVLERRSAR